MYGRRIQLDHDSPHKGSIRAFRALKYNAKYAKKLQAQKEREAAKAQAKARAAEAEDSKKQQAISGPNPFSVRFLLKSILGHVVIQRMRLALR